MTLRLGLDLGTNSIGWCLFSGHDASHILDAGVRIFSDGRNPKDKKPLNEVRRNMRGTRRNRDRQNNRFAKIIHILKQHNILNNNTKDDIFTINPYQARYNASTGTTDINHLARAILHLGKRRGFKSNRKAQDKDSGKIQAGIDKLKADLNNKTLGHYLYDKSIEQSCEKIRFTGDIENKFYPTREMYEEEFNAIKDNHKNLLSESAWNDIYDALFYQRPLKSVEKGKCIFFKDQDRIYKADPLFQSYRLWQDLQNLEYASETEYKGFIPCNNQQIMAIYKKCKTQKEVAFSTLKNLKDENKQPVFPSGIKFNLEKSKADKLKGLSTDAAFSNDKAFGQSWERLSDTDRTSIICKSLDTETDQDFIKFLMDNYNLPQTNAEYCAKISLESGVGSISAKFIEKILPFLYEMKYDKAVKNVMDDFGNPLHHSHFYTTEIHDALPYYGQVLVGQTSMKKSDADALTNPEGYYGKITNVSVHVALNQLQKLINALLNEYGHIDEIIIEVARDLKKSQKEISEIEKTNKKNQTANERIVKDLIALGITNPRRDDIIKYKLWEELNFENPDFRKCVFTGRIISQDDFKKGTEIEHILPLSRTFDDSYANKTITFTYVNRAKKNRSPFEAFGNIQSGEYAYGDILQRSQSLPTFKRWRFETNAMNIFHNDENLTDAELNKMGIRKKDMGFIARQLTDTAYICKASKQYLSWICDPNKIWVTPGKLTAMMRHHWGLNRLIGDDDKKDRSDHRHHMIDAFVIGKTTRGLIQHISTLTGISEQAGKSKVKLPELNPQLFNDFKDIFDNTLTSYKPDHGHGGSFFAETAYGILPAPDMPDKPDYILVTRKPIGNLSAKEIFAIRDNHIRNCVIDSFEKHFKIDRNLLETSDDSDGDDSEISVKKTKKDKIDKKELKLFLENFGKENKIKSLRILVSKGNARTITHGKNNQHTKAYMLDGFAFCDIYAVTTDKGKIDYKGHFVPVIDAKKIDTNKTHNHILSDDFKNSLDYNKYKRATAKKIMRLYKNDVVSLVQNGKEVYFKVFGYSTSVNALDIRPLNSPKNKQNFKAINVLMENQLKHVKLSVLGKRRGYGTNTDCRNQC